MFPLIPALTLLFLAQVDPIGPVPARIEVGAHMKGYYRFEWRGESVSGAPHTIPINRIVFRFITPGGEPAHWVTIDRPVAVGEVRVTFADALRGIPAGDWDFDVKVVNDAGQHGSYSERLERKIVVLGPRPGKVVGFREVKE